ncbi:hypothetical protein [Anatilimnocola floriformis]|uniref:hypothetical protein n=1 Tax=Anatilimnocola floriformis TaxID=2948575 RepID=UPI0020C520A5|nr:hypothetical protein [Anatilimnocola floriformis]
MASNAPQVASFAPAVRTKRSGNGLPIWAKIVLGVLGTLSCIAMVYGFVSLFGRVHGTELCAETLERRSFSFLEVPFIGWQIQATKYVDISGTLEGYLATEKLVPAPPAAKKTWHLITLTRGMTSVRRGQPQILCRYLDALNSKHESAWLAWSKDNPQLAPHVWQGVCDLALAGEYTAVPDLMELPRGATDAVALQKEIQRVVKEAVTAPAPVEPKK